MYLTLVLLPFLGAAVAGLRGRTLGATGAQLVATCSVGVAAVLALVAFYEVALCRSPVTIYVGTWLDCDPLYAAWAFTFDDLTVSMLLAVLCVSSLVHVFSMSYMADDPHTPRFFAYLAFFTASMVLLVTGDSYPVLFLGWELIGVASYLLIGFWLTRVQAQLSAIKAMTVNRVGDTVLSIGFFAMLWTLGSLEHATVLAVAPQVTESVATLLCLLLLGGAMSKSAQLPLHTWLADAMEGPTPVSALIHAATLVTAGVYLMLRTSPLLEYSPTALLVVAWLGATTAFFAATCGLLAVDAKRVIAFSTCSQLGYMFAAVGTSQYHAALYHLVLHAAMKALLFMSAGSVIHAMVDQQDVRRFGGLASLLPFTYTAMLVGSLSLMAIPGLTGFYSKDPILELAAGTYSTSGTYAYCLGTLAAGLTAFYSVRLLSLVFLGTPAAPRASYEHTHEAPFLLGLPLAVLGVLSIVLGYLAKDLWMGPGSDFLGAAFHLHPSHVALVEAEFGLPIMVKLLPAIVTIVGALAALYMYHGGVSLAMDMTQSSLGYTVYSYVNNLWRWNALVTGLVIKPSLVFGLVASKTLDRGLIETTGPYGLSVVLPQAGHAVARYDTSLVTTYALYVMLGLLTMVTLLYAPLLTGVTYSSYADHGLIMIFVVALGLLPSQGRA